MLLYWHSRAIRNIFQTIVSSIIQSLANLILPSILWDLVVSLMTEEDGESHMLDRRSVKQRSIVSKIVLETFRANICALTCKQELVNACMATNDRGQKCPRTHRSCPNIRCLVKFLSHSYKSSITTLIYGRIDRSKLFEGFVQQCHIWHWHWLPCKRERERHI